MTAGFETKRTPESDPFSILCSLGVSGQHLDQPISLDTLVKVKRARAGIELFE